MQLLRGTPSESYKKIPTYLYMLEYANPGSVTRLHTEGDGSFLYAFIAIYASIRGWVYCRPTVVVDGSFLKSTYRGTILTASTQDAEGKNTIQLHSVKETKNIFKYYMIPVWYTSIPTEYIVVLLHTCTYL